MTDDDDTVTDDQDAATDEVSAGLPDEPIYLDSVIVGEIDTMTRALIYRPHHVKEHIKFNGKLISCSESTTVMAADAVTMGGVRVTQERVRSMSSEPSPAPASPGLNIPQCLEVLRKLGIVGTFDATGKTWAYLWDGLNDDRRIMLQCEMSLLKSCSPAKTGHMIFLQAYRKEYGVLANDPMCDKERWYAPSTIRAAAEAFADATNVPGAGLRFAVTRKVPRIAVG